ncbi:ABC transporter ATP-binding protein/permease [Polycladidibacter hongkongensis]|uniref:ABC transporter ATP-binding protein/permease n=1 Tax=Polycladidibacter hongkongensis TaxID=1647556 RepID=UPI00083225BF|nr:ABC transporter ATP-binding protein/permease [Pseudovibrio hongkongensis]
MQKSLFKFIWQYSSRYQFVILLVTIASYPVSYILLDLPKHITNGAIQGSGFPVQFLGFEFSQLQYLLFLSLSFLFLVVVSNGFKLFLNVYKGRLGERMLRRLRFELYQRILRFKLPHFRKVSSAQLIPMITAEVEDVGGYIGESIALPAYQGGMLLVQIGFIFMQNVYLGLAAISLYPVQGYIIPKLQKKVIRLSRERVKNVRVIAEKLGETVAGINEIHANDTSAYHSADLSERLYRNFKIRFDIYNRKFLIKFLNNFMNQLTPFFFYLIGGYLVIEGDLSIGALLAVIAAYKDLAGPWKELLAFYQRTADVTVKYQTVIENFDHKEIYPTTHLVSDEVTKLHGPLKLEGVTAQNYSSNRSSPALTLTQQTGSSLAINGSDGNGRGELMQTIAGLLPPVSGHVALGDNDLGMQNEATLGRQIAYVGRSPHIWTGTMRDNIYYSLRHRPQTDPKEGMETDNGERITPDHLRRRTHEAAMTANPNYSIYAGWDELQAAGVNTAQQLEDKAVDLCHLTGLGNDLYRMGLRSTLSAGEHHHVREKVLEARRIFAQRVREDPKLSNRLELWQMDSYNSSATVIENLFFANPRRGELNLSQLVRSRRVAAFLKAYDFYDQLISMGYQTVEMMLDLFGDVSTGSPLFATYSFISQEDLPYFQRLVRLCGSNMKNRSPNDEEKARLMEIALRIIPTKHRLGIVTPQIKEKLLEMRVAFLEREGVGSERFEFFDQTRYMDNMSVQDNIVFGKARLDRKDAEERIETRLRDIIMELDMTRALETAGLDFHVGSSGAQLNLRQKQLVALVTALLRQNTMIVIDDILSGTDTAAKERRQQLRAYVKQSILVVGTTNPEIAAEFDESWQLEANTIHQLATGSGNSQEEAPT